jgi:hypothetical protein
MYRLHGREKGKGCYRLQEFLSAIFLGIAWITIAPLFNIGNGHKTQPGLATSAYSKIIDLCLEKFLLW